MSYRWRQGANYGGGYGQVGDAQDGGLAVCIGDMWGIVVSTDGGKNWRAANLLAPTIPSGRAVALSRRPATRGWAFLGIGVSHGTTPGTGYFGVLSPDGRVRAVDTTPHGFGLNIEGANTLVPRPAGSTIVPVYDAASDVERIYALAPNGVTRYLNDATHGLGSNSLSPVRISTVAQCWKAAVALDQDRLLAATYSKTANGAEQTPRAYVLSGIKGATLSTSQVKSGLAVNALRWVGGKLYAACTDGLYRIDPSNPTNWTKLGGSFFARVGASASCVMDVTGTGSTLYVGQADAKDALPAGHAMAKSTDGGASWRWTGGVSQTSIYGTNERFWLAGLYPEGSMSGKRMDVNQLAIVDGTVLAFGRKGMWASPDEGATWWPAVRGIGGSVVNHLAVGAGWVNASDEDWTASESTDRFKTAKQASARPYPSSMLTRTVGGHVYRVLEGLPCDVTRDGTSIADDLFRASAVRGNVEDLAVASDGTVYVGSSGGGVIVGDPA